MTETKLIKSAALKWITICPLDSITIDTGVCALVKNQQVAIFRVGDGTQIYAISNYDPFSKAYVLSRGIVGDRDGIPKVASPIYKQNFSLITGECLDSSEVKIPTFEVQVQNGQVQIGILEF